ncbi:HNH endonuclease [Mycolicibacterium sp. CBMA 226]|uniref:HNH endonuclease n=1 Tax=Mycolicibacterium sp. CBMA 226 TaxID=2606611 RepID=UPI0012DC85AA|nr:HNH endonuclease [Mycolicibacterium sp. CBMA 226]
MQRPCVDCGCLIPSGSRCRECQRPRNNNTVKGKQGRTASDWHWRKLSQKLRRLSPFCEKCLAKTDLTVDHLIPISERPDLVHEELNCRVLCRTCNGERGDRCTDAERAQVLKAIEQRRQRRTYRSG